MTDMHGRGFCPRCLLKDVPEGEALAALMAQWLEAIPPERRTEDALYRDRLSRCRACPHLSAGLCALCGCYVEYRAAQSRQRCPDVPGRW
ncbi:MAG: hypothetical protein IJ124_06575 [Clostridia bacterium]|nr:hypothetical protein [Clostridia bacterium]